VGGGLDKALLFAVLASAPLPLGALVGVWRPPPRAITAGLLAFASGALITAVAFELFDEAFRRGGAWRAGLAFAVGATAFIVADSRLDRATRRRRASGLSVGLALLAGVTLDGVPENVALGVGLIDGGSAALLVAIFVSNLPEAVVGAQKMREARLAPRTVVAIWSATGVLLGAAVVIGYAGFESVGGEALAWPLGFAGGAVLASLADTLMPEAFAEAENRPSIAYATALGFLLAYLVSVA
jgi:zinc transporter, ZIP family